MTVTKRGAFWPTAFLAAALLLAPAAIAQVNDCPGGAAGFPCKAQIDGVKLTRVPSRFRVQARVAQAKLPIGKGLFEKLTVRVLRGATPICREDFTQVEVTGSVLNLVIGPEMSCDLGWVVARESNLSLQLCPNDPDNCLDPIPFSSAPSAVKASYASRARKANRTEIAGQAHYGHRWTADRDLVDERMLGAGYLQVVGRSGADQKALWPEPAVTAASLEGAAVLAWTPVRRPTARRLHLVGKHPLTQKLAPLRQVVLGARLVHARGALRLKPRGSSAGLSVVRGGMDITGDSDVSGTLTVSQGLTVSSGGLDVTGDAQLVGSLAVDRDMVAAGNTTVLAGGIHAGGAAAAGVAWEGLVPARVTGTLAVQPTLAALPGNVADSAASANTLVAGHTLRLNGIDIKVVGDDLVIDATGAASRLRIGSGFEAVAPATFQGAVKLKPKAGACPPGQVSSAAGACVDLDECAQGVANCHANADCTNTATAPGFTCACKQGFTGDGVSCACPAGQLELDGVCRRRIRTFVTFSTWTGDLGGRAGADQKCQAAAAAGGHTGQWRAWLSDNGNQALSLLPSDPVYFENLNGSLAARSKPDLLDGTAGPFATFENGYAVHHGRRFWSGTHWNGVRATGTCSGWTRETGKGTAGNATSPAHWSNFQDQDLPCTQKLSLLCMEK